MMSTEVIVKQFRIAVMVIFALLVLGVVSSTLTAAQSCRRVQGQFTLQPLSGPTCTSPVGICATGSYRGALRGDSVFTGSSVTPTVDTPTTSAILLTGDNLIQTDNGTLTTKDAIVLRTTGAGEFAEVDVIVAGTGEWAGATGTLTATGTFDASTGGEGRFEGEICTP